LKRYGAIRDLLWYLLAVVLILAGVPLFAKYMDGRLILGIVAIIAGIGILIWNTIKKGA
jgi:hypothetical protein